MPRLKNIITGIDFTSTHGALEREIVSVRADSRKVEKDSLFVAIKGLQTDGHQYIDQAIAQGAVAILAEQIPDTLQPGVSYLVADNSARALGLVAANFYDNPSQHLKVVGVTGTNGKTTTATLLFRLFRKLGYNTGLLSTVQNQINEDIIPTVYTTPDPLVLQSLLAEMVHRGCTHCFMEVSSHALAQERVAGLSFTGAIFTNITHDHLDFHQTFDNYIRAKKKLFDALPAEAFAVVNIDDKRGLVMLQNCQAQIQKSFALRSPADFKARLIENTLEGLLLDIEDQEVWFRLIGDFNAYNLLGVYTAAVLLGEKEADVLTELSSIGPAPGRFEQVHSPQSITAIVDYAHTPDALKNVLMTVEQLKQSDQQVITVVGCGGDRDRSKRPVMARIAVEFSDQVIFTSDNPRHEDPWQILSNMTEVLSPIEKAKVQVIENRREAIQTACNLAQGRDIIMVAGKGHETYQEIKGQRYPFDDREVLKEFLNHKQ
ncbi:MAG: UDP-N-acetylmuramoyl-L-alanyl-D-glutamate--2,6-diaminopimelate ligase [Bacteroidia bacterium]|nr:UDP-N-acetylmuramoyl-L-alanyl-D-glutamate--2,6-diaminopimelate ligase [Bacteroidia bacterium]